MRYTMVPVSTVAEWTRDIVVAYRVLAVICFLGGIGAGLMLAHI